jgi:hypothetical protein
MQSQGKTHPSHPLDNKMCRHILWAAFGHFKDEHCKLTEELFCS